MFSKQSFLNTARPIDVVINGVSHVAEVKEFSSGSVGWSINGKLTVMLPHGEIVQCQVGLNLTVIGSKGWPAVAAQPAKAAA